MKKQQVIFVVLFQLLLLIGQASGVFAVDATIDSINLLESLPAASTLLDAYKKTNCFEAWQYLNGSVLPAAPVTIGVVDTGFDSTHPEFTGVDFGDTPPDARIDVGELDLSTGKVDSHGTNVTGVIGANNISGLSSSDYIYPQMNGVVSGFEGVHYKLEVRRVTFPVGPVPVPTATFMTVWDMADKFASVSHSGAGVVNVSIGGFELAAYPLFTKVMLAHSDVLWVVAAGNDNRSAALSAPAFLGELLSNVITVGATTEDDGRASFSNFGPAVNIAAPGDDNFGVWSPTFFAPPLDLFGDYRLFAGTSAATPMVTGVAAIIKAINPTLSPAQIKDILIRSADPIQTGEPDKRLGTGCYASPADPVNTGCRLNALGAVLAATPPPAPVSLLRMRPQYTTANHLGVFWSRYGGGDFVQYELYRAAHAGVTTADQLIATVTDNGPASFFFRDDGLAPGTYFYRVFVFDSAGLFSGSNELAGEIFAPNEVIERIPGVPEPGDTTFPANVAIPRLVSDRLQFECTQFYAADPASETCTGTYVSIGPVLDAQGHVSKYRFFPTVTIENLSFNGISDFEFVDHVADNLQVTLLAQDDSYVFIQPDFGFDVDIPQGTQFLFAQSGGPAGPTGMFLMSLKNSAGATAVVGSIVTVP